MEVHIYLSTRLSYQNLITFGLDVQDMVASDDITLFIHTQATISIAVIGKTDVQALFNHELL